MNDHSLPWADFAADASPRLDRYKRHLAQPREIQEQLLKSMLRDNARSAFGKQHDFANIRSLDDYRNRVPIADWSDVAPWVTQTMEDNDPVLTASVPLFLEPTSGSSAATKLIPYTNELLVEFQRAIIVWLAQLYKVCPNIGLGRSYWAMSPAGVPQELAANGIPVGSASDAQYLAGSCAERLVSCVLSPRGLKDEGENWRLGSLAEMIETPDLCMISVWSPTFLSALLKPLMYGETEGFDLLANRISRPRRVAAEKAVTNGDLNELWPALEIVSCWMDGPSAAYVTALQAQFSQTRFTPKGLLATEGVVSIPWGLTGACPLAIESHFLEFVDEDDRIFCADEITEGGCYRPLLTTGGGLYRYCLGDIVEVTGFLEQTPCVRFIGRSDTRSDLVGEKLDERLVSHACRVLPAGVKSAFLVPHAAPGIPHYRLFVDATAAIDVAQIGAALEREFLQVFHYAQARKVDQLGPVTVTIVESCADMLQLAWEAIGKRAGDAKPAKLITSTPFAEAIAALVPTAIKA